MEKNRRIAQHKPKIPRRITIVRAPMEITVRYFTVLSKLTEKRQEKIKLKEGSTLEDMLTLLVQRYGENFERYVSSGRARKGLQLVLLLNGQDAAQLNGLKTTLHDGDTVTLMPPIAGG
jgi:MoaD family protein